MKVRLSVTPEYNLYLLKFLLKLLRRLIQLLEILLQLLSYLGLWLIRGAWALRRVNRGVVGWVGDDVEEGVCGALRVVDVLEVRVRDQGVREHSVRVVQFDLRELSEKDAVNYNFWMLQREGLLDEEVVVVDL